MGYLGLLNKYVNGKDAIFIMCACNLNNVDKLVDKGRIWYTYIGHDDMFRWHMIFVMLFHLPYCPHIIQLLVSEEPNIKIYRCVKDGIE